MLQVEHQESFNPFLNHSFPDVAIDRCRPRVSEGEISLKLPCPHGKRDELNLRLGFVHDGRPFVAPEDSRRHYFDSVWTNSAMTRALSAMTSIPSLQE
jgi:hypothetical protein